MSENAIFLPGVPLPSNIVGTANIMEVGSAEAVLLAAPAQHIRAAAVDVARAVVPGTPLVLCAKGVERGSGKLLTEVLREAAPQAEPAILSGPSFARDVAHDLPTAVTIAAKKNIA